MLASLSPSCVFSTPQIAEKLEAVTEAREELLTKWEVKRELLNQLQAEQVFLRDVEQLHTISSQQEVGFMKRDENSQHHAFVRPSEANKGRQES